MAADALSGQQRAETERHDRAIEAASLHHDAVKVEIAGMPARRGSGRGGSAAGDPQTFADVTAHLRSAKTRDAAQAILDSDEGSLLSDRQYARLQKLVDETHGTFTGTHKTPPGQKPRSLNPDEIRTLNRLGAAIPQAKDPVAALHALAKQWNMPLDQAAGFVP